MGIQLVDKKTGMVVEVASEQSANSLIATGRYELIKQVKQSEAKPSDQKRASRETNQPKKPELKKHVTEKDLEKLAALADLELYTILHAPEGAIPEEERNQFLRAFTTVHYYFARLTLDALQDRKRAEWLASILDRLEQRMIMYTGALGSFAQLLQLKHEIKGALPLPAPPEKMEEGIKHLIQTTPYKMVMVAHERVRQKDDQASKEELRKLAENTMFL